MSLFYMDINLISDLRALYRAAKRRKGAAFRPGTQANQQSQMKLYISFCLHYNLEILQPSSQNVCAYIEFLTRSFKSPDSIRNYVSGIRHLHRLININSDCLESFEVNIMLRALDLTMHHFRKPHTVLTVDIIQKLITKCDRQGPQGLILKTAILFSFYGFLRKSNLAPESVSKFDPLKNTCRGDILFQHPGLVIILKWSKTLQDNKSVYLIPLPKIEGHSMCPVQAFINMTQAFPTVSPNEPLLHLGGQTLRMVTTSWLNKQLAELCKDLGYVNPKFTWHDFRRAGAETCFRAGVEITQIQHHGTWKSDSFWDYISRSARCTTSDIPGAMAQVTLGQ